MLGLHHCRRETCHVPVSTHSHKRHVMAFSVRNTPQCNICCIIKNKKSNLKCFLKVTVLLGMMEFVPRLCQIRVLCSRTVAEMFSAITQHSIRNADVQATKSSCKNAL